MDNQKESDRGGRGVAREIVRGEGTHVAPPPMPPPMPRPKMSSTSAPPPAPPRRRRLRLRRRGGGGRRSEPEGIVRVDRLRGHRAAAARSARHRARHRLRRVHARPFLHAPGEREVRHEALEAAHRAAIARASPRSSPPRLAAPLLSFGSVRVFFRPSWDLTFASRRARSRPRRGSPSPRVPSRTSPETSATREDAEPARRRPRWAPICDEGSSTIVTDIRAASASGRGRDTSLTVCHIPWLRCNVL